MKKGHTISDYVIGDKISSGSYGSVFEAYNTVDQNEYVIKFNKKLKMNKKEGNILACL